METPAESLGFTPKAPAIEGLMESITGRKRESGHCVWEDNKDYHDEERPVNLDFRTPVDRREYSISGMCQLCQDAFYGKEE